MNGGDSTLFRIDEKDRDAVGGLNAEKQASAIGGGSISAAGFDGRGVE